MEGLPIPDPLEVMGNVLAEVIRFASAAERIGAAARACTLPLEMLAALDVQDPELRPELVAAAQQLTEVVETLTRAHTFVDARLDARLSSLAESLGFPEGGTPA